jgi:hypothetical protein
VSGAKTITLAGAEYEVGPFTLKQVKRLLPLLEQSDTKTVPGTDALATIAHIGVECSKPGLTYDDFLAIKGVTMQELMGARQTIGLMIGYLVLLDKAPRPGEAQGEASPPAD